MLAAVAAVLDIQCPGILVVPVVLVVVVLVEMVRIWQSKEPMGLAAAAVVVVTMAKAARAATVS